MLKLKDLEFSYDGGFALSIDGLAVGRGEMLGITGPNGSGKSTFLKLVSGILKGYTGSMELDGNELSGIHPRRRARIIGYVPQIESLFFPVKVIETVLQGRYPHHRGIGFEREEDLESARSSLEMVGISHLENRVLSDISGGELRRVIIARALAQKPELLLLDEVTVNLDINVEIEIMEMLQRLHEKGMAIVMVSHDIDLLARYAPFVAVMHRGGLIGPGRPGEILTADLIKKVYGIDVRVEQEEPGTPRIIPERFTGKKKQS